MSIYTTVIVFLHLLPQYLKMHKTELLLNFSSFLCLWKMLRSWWKVTATVVQVAVRAMQQRYFFCYFIAKNPGDGMSVGCLVLLLMH